MRVAMRHNVDRVILLPDTITSWDKTHDIAVYEAHRARSANVFRLAELPNRGRG